MFLSMLLLPILRLEEICIPYSQLGLLGRKKRKKELTTLLFSTGHVVHKNLFTITKKKKKVSNTTFLLKAIASSKGNSGTHDREELCRRNSVLC